MSASLKMRFVAKMKMRLQIGLGFYGDMRPRGGLEARALAKIKVPFRTPSGNTEERVAFLTNRFMIYDIHLYLPNMRFRAISKCAFGPQMKCTSRYV